MTGIDPKDPVNPSEPNRFGDPDDIEYEPGLELGPEPVLLPLGERLRLETRAMHDIIESVASFNRLILMRLDPLPDSATAAQQRQYTRARADYRDTYRKFLLATFAFEASVLASLKESPVDATARAHMGYPLEDPPSTILLRADLTAAFGEPVARRAVRMPSLPVIRTLPEWVGTEYVRLGSREGAPVIAAAVEHNLGFTRDHGASYLGRHGLEARAHLDRLAEWIDVHDFTGDDADAAVNAAIRTYEGVGIWRRMFDAMTR